MTYTGTSTDVQAREYRTFKLSDKQIDLVRSVADDQAFFFPNALEATHRRFGLLQAVWEVIAEALSIQVETVRPHPDNIPYILAKPARRLREKTRDFKDFDDDEHRTPNR